MPDEVKAENGNAKPEKKEFYCEVSGCLWWVFSGGRHREVCGDWGPRSRSRGAAPGGVGKTGSEGAVVWGITRPVPGRAAALGIR